MKVVLTDQALDSLEELVLYIAETSSENRALLIGRALIKEAMSLDTFSSKGSIEPALESLNEQHRRLIYEHRYKIVYRIVGETIFVTDFFDTRQNPSKMKG